MNRAANNSRIAKNTLILYARMILVMLVTLYSVKIVLNVLGIIDFGIYSVVGGIVIVFSFLSNSMASASMRFFSFEIGKGNTDNLKNTFSTTVLIYIIISIFLIFFAETIGLWFLNNRLIIPLNRLEAANIIYHFAIASFVLTILTIPLNSLIIAKENMKSYAYIGLFDVILKLLILFPLKHYSYDKLIFYGILMFICTIIISIIYYITCKRNYVEVYFSAKLDKHLFNQILSYSGWNLFGTISAAANDQGLNIVLNMFHGPSVNAARAIAYRISSALASLSQNFYTAVNPQIIKTYATNDIDYMLKLVFQSSKYGYYLILLFSVPLFFEIESVLKIWLGDINTLMIIFTKLAIIYTLIITLENPLTQAARATGSIRTYQIAVGCITLTALPISFYLMERNYPPETTMYVIIIVYFLATFVRLFVLKSLINFPVWKYLKEVLFRASIVTILSTILPAIISYSCQLCKFKTLYVFFSGVVSVIAIVYIVGMDKEEQKVLLNYLKVLRDKINS